MSTRVVSGKSEHNYEQLICSMLLADIISFNDYTFGAYMFFEPPYKTYIEFIEKNKNTLRTAELNKKFLSLSSPGAFLSGFKLENILEAFDIKSIIESFYKRAFKKIYDAKLDETTSSPSSSKSGLDEISDVLFELKNLVDSLNAVNERELPNRFDSYRKYYDEMEIQQADSFNGQIPIVGVATGFSLLDQIMRGLKPSSYTIVAGRPSMGKTSFALDIVASALKQGKAVLFFSLEMNAEQIISRLIPKINDELTLEETFLGANSLTRKPAIMTALAFLEEQPFYIEDFSGGNAMTISEMGKICDLFVKKYGALDLVVVDHVQLVKSEVKSFDENAQLTQISRDTVHLAKRLKTAWVTLSQLSRELEKRTDKRPMPADLRGSGSLEQDADYIIFPYRESVYLERALKNNLRNKPDSQMLSDALHSLINSRVENAEIILAKNRNGPTGSAEVQWFKDRASYKPMGFSASFATSTMPIETTFVM